ncbi:MAG: helix-hairpin-helix domain-containing protein [Phycisphaerales bacterium]|nr:helix-hairpin-helix domain-containing protein [Phycisphaerales bacterium]
MQHATKEELMLLEGIGTSLASRIIAYRKAHVLESAEDLQQIHGIGPMKVARLQRTVRKRHAHP